MAETTGFLARTSKRFLRNRRGGIAVSFAITLPMLFGAIGLAADYAMMGKIRGDLQEAADAAALAGAREIPLAKSNPKQVESAVHAFAAYRLTENSSATAEDLGARNYTVAVSVVDDFSSVDVTISEKWTPFFAHFLSAGVTPISVSSKARFVGRNNICVLGLATSKVAVHADRNSRLTGNNCGVFSNSTSSNGFFADNGAVVRAAIICSAGGASVSSSSSVEPSPITDCPPIEDPLASRANPNVGGCDYGGKNGTVVDGMTKSLNPGVYCGGLAIKGTSTVTLNPGVYVIKDGGLNVTDDATLRGDGVGFFITGDSAAPTIFTAKTHVSLSAPASGPMAGLLLFEDRNTVPKLRHRISSNDARLLLGTIYLPVGGLLVDSQKPVADQSAYTAIVAQTVELDMGPNLILNANYDITEVPAPAGIAGSSQVVLSR